MVQTKILLFELGKNTRFKSNLYSMRRVKVLNIFTENRIENSSYFFTTVLPVNLVRHRDLKTKATPDLATTVLSSKSFDKKIFTLSLSLN